MDAGVYFQASAQDSLHLLLLAAPIQSQVNLLGNYISNWFDHLYAQNMRRISQPGSSNAMGGVRVGAAGGRGGAEKSAAQSQRQLAIDKANV